MLTVVLWWGSSVEPASGASLKKPLSSLSLVMVGSHHHPSTPACPLWSQRRGSGALGALGREAHKEQRAAKQCCVLLQRALGSVSGSN